MTTVSKLDDTTVAVSDGKSVLLLKDLNKDGKVDEVAVGTQNEEQFYFGDLSGENVILTGEHGDPHVRQKLFIGDKTNALKGSLNALLADARDGTLDNSALLTTALTQTVNGGVDHEIMDVQADHTLHNAGMKARVDVQAKNEKVAFAETAVIVTSDGREYAIRNLWNATGSDGAIGVGVAEAAEGGESKATFVTMDEKRMGLAGTTLAFGVPFGTVGKYILDAQGKLDPTKGQAAAFWPEENNYSALYKAKKYDPTEVNSTSPTFTGSSPLTSPSVQVLPAPTPPIVRPTPPVSPSAPAMRDSVADEIANYYRVYLRREPDAEGYKYWTDQVKSKQMTLAEVRNHIQFSPEAQVYGFYLEYLKRPPEAAGLAYWRDQIRNGLMTAAQVENAVKNSDEAKKLR